MPGQTRKEAILIIGIILIKIATRALDISARFQDPGDGHPGPAPEAAGAAMNAEDFHAGIVWHRERKKAPESSLPGRCDTSRPFIETARSTFAFEPVPVVS
jgi:hypothetical protein